MECLNCKREMKKLNCPEGLDETVIKEESWVCLNCGTITDTKTQQLDEDDVMTLLESHGLQNTKLYDELTQKYELGQLETTQKN